MKALNADISPVVEGDDCHPPRIPVTTRVINEWIFGDGQLQTRQQVCRPLNPKFKNVLIFYHLQKLKIRVGI